MGLGQAAGKPRVVRERVIIERPRLMKKLDESEARTILLLAPAGYGKTTLARQWRATLSRAVWLTLTPAHRDVTVIARDLAESLEEAGDEGFRDFMEQYIRARPNPQGDAALIGRVLAEAIGRTRTEWVIVDDYHDLGDIDEAHLLVRTLLEKTTCRFLVASRTRPPWATARREIYGDIATLNTEQLAMDTDEAKRTLGATGRDAIRLIELAAGWPAVLSLARSTRLTHASTGPGAEPQALHRYLTEEYLASLGAGGRAALFRLALVPGDVAELNVLDGEDRRRLEGMLEEGHKPHRLVRDFLLTALAADDNRQALVTDAVAASLGRGMWSNAFALIERFNRLDLAEEAISRAYFPLLNAGRLWTLQSFVNALPTSPSLEGVSSVVRADTAVRSAAYGRALHFARLAQRALRRDHILASRAAGLEGESYFWLGRHREARRSFLVALSLAQTISDRDESLFFLCRCDIYLLECPPPASTLTALAERRQASDSNAVREAIVQLGMHRVLGRRLDHSHLISETLPALDRLEDPAAISSFLHASGYAYLLAADYETALTFSQRANSLTETFEMHSARMQTLWLFGAAALGRRDYANANRAFNTLQDMLDATSLDFNRLNLLVLRARILFAMGRSDEALEQLTPIQTGATVLSMESEYIATRAVALALCDKPDNARRHAAQAISRSRGIEGRCLAAAALAIANLNRDADGIATAFETARRFDCWDPLVVALRASRPLVEAVRNRSDLRETVQQLCARADDRHLARTLGVVLTGRRRPGQVLSPREREVLDLLEAGMRNQQIANALFISEATVKVHIRHIFEKLGVHTRAQAVARARD